tara:strand:+ start:3751 stop:4593 length:843 start_codon:yes stop_codon:yes gene_type:complete
MDLDKKQKILKIFETDLKGFADSLVKDYSVGGSKRGNIEKKKNNFLIAGLGKEIMVYSALMRSLDSSLGNRIESLALKVAEASGYTVSQGVEGLLSSETTKRIATLVASYKDKGSKKKPASNDLQLLEEAVENSEGKPKFHNSDYLLAKEENGVLHFSLLELKIGGDLDNKKARSEKRAILEQYAILYSQHKEEIKKGKVKISIFFATAYNKDSLNHGSENWKQASVRSFFAPDEFLIGRDFWNYICDDDKGWELITLAYKENSPYIKNALNLVIDSFKD